ncbi:MAG TPA: hypothetical protein VJB95_02030 [Candidatus Paceibacterota bacterium]
MDKRKSISILFMVSMVGIIVGYILTNSTKFNICVLNQTITEATCINFYERLGDPLFYGMLALTVVFLILLFIPRAFDAWRKFAVWFIPLAVLLFIFYPDPGSGDLFSPYPEQVFQWVSGLYVLISVFIIVRAARR